MLNGHLVINVDAGCLMYLCHLVRGIFGGDIMGHATYATYGKS